MSKIELMIIGAQKAGTTSLLNYLKQHQELLGNNQTEFAYFVDDRLYNRGFEYEFHRHFTNGKVAGRKIIAKNAILYNSEKGLKRLRMHNPACKLVFVVREPVDRAFSSYSMEVFNGWLKRDFSEIKSIILSSNRDDVMYRLFIDLGMYSEALKLIYSYFPSVQVRIALFEDFVQQPGQLCQEIYKWLDVDPDFMPDTSVMHNETRQAKSSVFARILLKFRQENNPVKRAIRRILPYSVFSRMGSKLVEMNKSPDRMMHPSPELCRFLYEYFRPYNDELKNMTGLDLSKWERHD